VFGLVKPAFKPLSNRGSPTSKPGEQMEAVTEQLLFSTDHQLALLDGEVPHWK